MQILRISHGISFPGYQQTIFQYIHLYTNDCVYWYTNEDNGKWFVDTLGKRFHVNFLGYEHWFISIRTSQMKDHFVSVYQARYVTSVVAKYLDTATVRRSKLFYKTTFPYYIIFPGTLCW